LCDYVIGYDNGKADIYGLFNAVRPKTYPHTQTRFCVFAQLVGGLGDVPFFIDIVFRERAEVVWTTGVHRLHFPNREVVVQMVVEIQGCEFAKAGSYLLELYCDNVCVADVPLHLLAPENNHEQQQTT
jgi:hypothetical protein